MNIEKIRGLISQMRLQDKISLLSGGVQTTSVDRLSVPSVLLSDELELYSVKEPSALAIGCTFSHTLAAALSKRRAQEAARAKNTFAGVIGCGLILDAMRQDAVEFFSEDAYLTGELLKNYAQTNTIGYVFTDALGQGRYVNRTIDSRALYELYLYPLRAAGKYAAAIQLDGGYLNSQKISSSRVIADMYSEFMSPDAMMLTLYGDGTGVPGILGSGAYQLGASADERKEIARAVSSGEINEERVNTAIERTLAAVLKSCEYYYHHAEAPDEYVNIIGDSTVLLKNDGSLPLRNNAVNFFGDGEYFDDADAFSVLPIKDALKKYGTQNVFLITDYEENGIDPAVAEIICRVGAASTTIVAICGGCATPLPILNSVNAVMFCPYCPSLFALFALLTTISPRGHLPFTWCKTREAYPRNNKKFLERGDFRYESMYNGYTLFNKFDSDSVLFPFGFGLDYTKYELSKLQVTADGLKIKLDFVVKNVGNFAGTAVCQAYISLVDGNVYGMTGRLAAFKRVPLEKTENSSVSLEIDLNNFKVYDESNNSLVPIGGKYRIDLGFSSTDIHASAEVKIAVGSRVNAGLNRTLAPSYYALGKPFKPTAPEIERLLKVPFIKKPDEYPDLDPPDAAIVKRVLKKAEKGVHMRLLPLLRFRARKTPVKS